MSVTVFGGQSVKTNAPRREADRQHTLGLVSIGKQEVPMRAMPRITHSEFFPASLLVKRSVEAPGATDLKNDQSPNERPALGRLDPRDTFALLGRLDPLAFARYLIVFFVGVTATLAWQSYRGTARETIAPASSPSEQQLKTMSLNLDAVRQSIERIAMGIVASQEQMTRGVDRLAAGQEQTMREMNELQTVEQYVLDRISTPPPRPAPTTVSKPVPRSPQAPIQLTPAKTP
jgi:hypothetical protein